MKRTLSLALAACQVIFVVPVTAKQPVAGTVSPADACGIPLLGDGPLARSALREASMTPLRTTTTAQEKAGSQQPSPSALRQAAGKIPLGKTVDVRTVSGQKVRGSLLSVEEAGVVVERRYPTRDNFGNRIANAKPSERIEIPYETMQSIGRPMGPWTKVLIGFGIYVGASLLYFAINPIDT